MTRKHHFLVFRHCLRSTSANVDSAVYGSSGKMADYIGEPLPNWGVGNMQCTALGKELIEQTGAWLIESGTIDPVAKVKWEFIAHDVTRDKETAFHLSTGIQNGIEQKYGTDGIESVNVEKVHVDNEFFDASVCDDVDYPTQVYVDEVNGFLQSLPRPTLSFKEGLLLLMRLAGTGKQGDLTQTLSLEPVYDEKKEQLTGAANLLCDISETMLYARASGIRPKSIPNATAQEIFELYQFSSWYRSIKHVDSIESAICGALQVQIMLRVLRLGYYKYPIVGDSDDDDYDGDDDDDDDDYDDDAVKEEEVDDYDTTVTIFFGHDDDLDYMATALGARWIAPKPYISGPGGAFVPTPPMSGIHAVRDVDADTIDLSFVCPMYAATTAATTTSNDDEDSESQHFHVNKTGILEHVPLLFQKQVPFSNMDDRSTWIQPPAELLQTTSLDVLENHVLGVLSGFHKSARQCWYSARVEWGPTTVSDNLVALTSFTLVADSEAPQSVLFHGPFLAILLVCVGIVIGRCTARPWLFGKKMAHQAFSKKVRGQFARLPDSDLTESTELVEFADEEESSSF